MKKLLFLLLIITAGLTAKAQSDPKQRDSVANTAEFQYKTRSASIKAGYAILADTTLKDATTAKFSQLLISQPQGSWITAMSYGVMNNNAINYDSPQADIEFTVNSIFKFQAYAWYQVSPFPPPVVQQ
jgi:hypothetical protein